MAPNEDREIAGLIRAAMGGAAILMAHHVAAKAARDALFLAHFPVADLPKIVATAAVVTVFSGIMLGRVLIRRSPSFILLTTLAVSALLHLGEFALISRFRGIVVPFTYLHIVSASSIALSLFWSIANETFSLGEAKRHFGKITAAGTVGGAAGGLLAARVATGISLDSLLVMAALLQATAIAVIATLGRRDAQRLQPSEGSFVSTLDNAVRRAPFLKSLALLVLLSSVGGVMIDFLFKSSAASAYGKGPALAGFFALFYTSTQVAAFLLQVVVTPQALRVLGLGKTIMTLPVALAAGGVASMWAPVLASFTSTRVGEAILKGSLFRAGYELFFTAIPSNERRAVKTAIDVGCDRMGELAGAGIIQVFLMSASGSATQPLLLLMIGFAVVCIWISARMDRAYLRALEQGLLHRAIELKEEDVEDSTTLSGWMNSLPQISRPVVRAQPVPKTEPENRNTSRPRLDPAVDQLVTLRSGVAADVIKALDSEATFDGIVVPQVIRLLAWDQVTDSARQYLERHSTRVTGQLTDALIDTHQDFSVRRRIPRILARIPEQRVVEALADVLEDPRFEIRFHSSRALEILHRTNPGLRFNETRLMEAVVRELSVSRTIWESRRMLDKRDNSDSQFSYLDEILEDRADQSMEHVFSMLAILLPREPLKVAFRALHGDDRLLRGLGLEYLETVLPPRTFALLSAMIGTGSPAGGARPPQEVVDALMASQESIRLKVKIASGDAPAIDPRQRPATPA